MTRQKKSETDQGAFFPSGLLSTFSKVTIIEAGDVVQRHTWSIEIPLEKGKKDLQGTGVEKVPATENLTQGNLPKRQHSRSVIRAERKSRRSQCLRSKKPAKSGIASATATFDLRGSLPAKNHTGRILVFAPSFQTLHSAHSSSKQKIKKESPCVNSRLLLLFSLHKLCAILILFPSESPDRLSRSRSSLNHNNDARFFIFDASV